MVRSILGNAALVMFVEKVVMMESMARVVLNILVVLEWMKIGIDAFAEDGEEANSSIVVLCIGLRVY